MARIKYDPTRKTTEPLLANKNWKKHTHIFKYTHSENEWMWFTLGAGFMAPQLIKCDSKLQQQPDPLKKTERRFIQIMD